ncbi:hypothetical protein H4R18_004129, partial [Coemansia javaensis]
FLAALAGLFASTKEAGSVALTLKRYDYQGVKEERQKKRARQAPGEEALRLLAGSMSLEDKEYATLVRAATDKKKLSTLVAPAALDEFLARYHGLLLSSVDSIRKSDRLRRKKKAIMAKKKQKAAQAAAAAAAAASASASAPVV